ncbi:hypothetical protein F5Y18DRAFT_426791 [Xylariaceae sp. FL1019]|nr:hypothetical protein F5Y18DRAFT_426791 [Xylariaceae sp. FL1019]
MHHVISLSHDPGLSSLATLCTESIQPHALVATGLKALLRRTQSMPQQPDIDMALDNAFGDNNGRDETLQIRPHSPIRANSKRRRSVISQNGESSRKRRSLSRFESVDLGSGSSRSHSRCTSRSEQPEQRDDTHNLHLLTRDELYVQPRSRERFRDREPSRGRPRRRKFSLINENIIQTDRSSRPLLQRIASNHRGLGRGSSTSYSSFDANYAVLLPVVDQAVDLQSSTVRENVYVTKGNFRLQNHELTKFRYPDPPSSPEPVWYAGDGFTAAEAKPEFFYRMTGKSRGKSSRSLPALGQLIVEQDSPSEDGQSSATFAEPRPKTSKAFGVKPHYLDVEEDWPTKQNFYEVVQQSGNRSKPNVSRKRSVILNKELSHPVLSQKGDSESNPILPRKRQRSHFEKFGRCQRRSRSRHKDTSALAPTGHQLGLRPLPYCNNDEGPGDQYDELGDNQSTGAEDLEEEHIRAESVSSPLHSSESEEDAELEGDESQASEETDHESMSVSLDFVQCNEHGSKERQVLKADSLSNDPTSKQQDECRTGQQRHISRSWISHACKMSLDLSSIN